MYGKKLQHPCTDLDHESLNKIALQHPCTEKDMCPDLRLKENNENEAPMKDVRKRDLSRS